MTLADEIIYRRYNNVIALLNAGADVNEIDDYGYTPLIEAAITNDVDIAKLLIDHGAKINEQDTTGGTALHWAAENHNLTLCKLLLDNGANPNAYTLASQPVLLKPLLRNQTDLINLLVRYGADITFAEDFINTKLMGHRFELTGGNDIVTPDNTFVDVEFEGFILEFTLGIIAHTLKNFKQRFKYKEKFPHFNCLQRVINAYEAAAELIYYQQYMINIDDHLDRINTLLNRPLLLLPLGYEGHAITFIKYGGLLAKCDRGENSLDNPSVIIYRMGNPRRFNKQFIRHMLYERQDKDFVDHQMPQHLGLTPITSLPLSSQIAGNCSWANVEAAMPTILFMMMFAEQQQKSVNTLFEEKDNILKLYQTWLQWDKDLTVNTCINNFYGTSNKARKATIASLLAAILFQRYDYIDPKDIPRADKILALLTTEPDYDYILKSYMQVYENTLDGDNLKALIDICGR